LRLISAFKGIIFCIEKRKHAPQAEQSFRLWFLIVILQKIFCVMKASVEISMYPLGREFKPDIKAFIERMKNHHDIICEVNGMSTQMFGDYREIMNALTEEIAYSFEKHGKSVFVLKIINAFLQQ
jgi:uncharacterized protein YqgV (UPF0045/DUF77 family)